MRKVYLEQTQNLKQIQRLILTPQMQQALHLLQLPVLELTQVINEEMENNPLLEAEESSDIREDTTWGKEEEDLRVFLESSIAYENSLFDHLYAQAQEVFLEEKKRELAKLIIGNLDSQGFLSTPLEEIAMIHDAQVEELEPILKEIQTFEPSGIAARTLQESLLIQLKAVGKEGGLAYRIIQDHFSSMLHNKIPLIAKSLKTTPKRIRLAIEQEIARLDLHPGSSKPFSKNQEAIFAITPDVRIHETDNGYTIEVMEAGIPSLKLNHSYLRMLDDVTLSKETKDYIREKIASGKWLLRNLHERNHTLYRITEEILRYQKDFFAHPSGKLLPLTMKAVSEKLELHESTVARAVSNKYLSSPRGVLPFRFFFTHAYITDHGEILSSKTVKELLVEIIGKEDRHSPLSDEMISSMIKEQGIPCARRTVAKYRQELGIGSTVQRKIYC